MNLKAGIGHSLGILLLLAGASSPAASQSGASAWVGKAPIVETVAQIMARDAASPSSSTVSVQPRRRLSRPPAPGAVPSAASQQEIAGTAHIAGPFLPQTVGTSF